MSRRYGWDGSVPLKVRVMGPGSRVVHIEEPETIGTILSRHVSRSTGKALWRIEWDTKDGKPGLIFEHEADTIIFADEADDAQS